MPGYKHLGWLGAIKASGKKVASGVGIYETEEGEVGEGLQQWTQRQYSLNPSNPAVRTATRVGTFAGRGTSARFTAMGSFRQPPDVQGYNLGEPRPGN